jgi:hypothetical protein
MRPILLIAVAASALALAGCGGDAETASTDATATETAAKTTTEQTTETTAPTETTPAETTAAAPKPRTIVIVVDQGRPRGGIKRPKLDKGEKVVLVIRADAGEDVHLHGYDIEKRVTPGKAVRIPLTANLPGRFELELHHPDSLLAVLEVRP